MPDPVRSLEPPIPTETCERCGAVSDKTEDYDTCDDCGHLVCGNCQVRQPRRFRARMLCRDCWEAREPLPGEVDKAFLHERKDALALLAESAKWAACPVALGVLMALAEMIEPDTLAEEPRAAIADAIRRIPVSERPWRKK